MPEYTWCVYRITRGDSACFRVIASGRSSGIPSAVVGTIHDLADEARSDPDRPPNSEVLWVCSQDVENVLEFLSTNLEGSSSFEGGGPAASAEDILSESIRRFTERSFESSSDDSDDREEPTDPPVG